PAEAEEAALEAASGRGGCAKVADRQVEMAGSVDRVEPGLAVDGAPKVLQRAARVRNRDLVADHQVAAGEGAGAVDDYSPARAPAVCVRGGHMRRAAIVR